MVTAETSPTCNPVRRSSIREARSELPSSSGICNCRCPRLSTTCACCDTFISRPDVGVCRTTTLIVPVALYGLPLDYYNNYVQSVEAVTQSDVARVAQQYINPGSLAIVIVGDRKTIEQSLKAANVGPISIRDMTGQPIQ